MPVIKPGNSFKATNQITTNNLIITPKNAGLKLQIMHIYSGSSPEQTYLTYHSY